MSENYDFPNKVHFASKVTVIINGQEIKGLGMMPEMTYEEKLDRWMMCSADWSKIKYYFCDENAEFSQKQKKLAALFLSLMKWHPNNIYVKCYKDKCGLCYLYFFNRCDKCPLVKTVGRYEEGHMSKLCSQIPYRKEELENLTPEFKTKMYNILLDLYNKELKKYAKSTKSTKKP